MLLAPRYLPRLAALVGLFTRYGLKDFAQRQGLLAIAPESQEPAEAKSDDLRERGREFRKRLVELGPAYVKLGQVLSTRPDLLPPAYIDELRHLQDDVDPISFEDVEVVVEKELGGRISTLFASVDPEPLGSASLGQVHAAELRDGRAVVVKVQRPGIREVLADDIEFFREAAKFLSAHTKVGSRVDMIGVIQQLERALSDELLFQIATETTDLMSALPRRIDLITQRMVANDFALRIDTPQLSVLLGGIQKIANRVFTGLVLAGLLVASSMLLPYRRQLGTFGFIIAAVIGVYLAVSILITDRQRKT